MIEKNTNRLLCIYKYILMEKINQYININNGTILLNIWSNNRKFFEGIRNENLLEKLASLRTINRK